VLSLALRIGGTSLAHRPPGSDPITTDFSRLRSTIWIDHARVQHNILSRLAHNQFGLTDENAQSRSLSALTGWKNGPHHYRGQG
jgi:hypothetical protein